MSTVQPSPLLRRALYADGLVSGAAGLLLALFADALGALLGLPRELLFGAGLALLPFALLLAWMASREELPRGLVWAVVAINAVWVVDSLWLLVSGWVAPTALGYAFVIVQALAVVGFVEFEWLGLKRSSASLAAA